MNADNVKSALRELGSPERAKNSAWFFKTGEGQYGAGDVFIGVTVPEQRVVAKRFLDLSLDEVEKLLHSPEHEFRLTALIIWVNQYRKGGEDVQAEIFRRYLANTKWINNWDLVDSSAYQIVGAYLQGEDKSLLSKLAQSQDLWERRIAVLATFYYIQRGRADEALKIAEMLVHDKHDLIQKAVGWMLREVGKKCGQDKEEKFLKVHYKTMPRTMLRYAIERFEPEKRAAYLKGLI